MASLFIGPDYSFYKPPDLPFLLLPTRIFLFSLAFCLWK